MKKGFQSALMKQTLSTVFMGFLGCSVQGMSQYPAAGIHGCEILQVYSQSV